MYVLVCPAAAAAAVPVERDLAVALSHRLLPSPPDPLGAVLMVWVLSRSPSTVKRSHCSEK